MEEMKQHFGMVLHPVTAPQTATVSHTKSKRLKIIIQPKLGHPPGEEVMPVSNGCSSNCVGKMEHIHRMQGFPAHWSPGELWGKVLHLAETQDTRKGSIIF